MASPIPVQVTGVPSGVTSVSVGRQFACAVTADGAVWCWGENSGGELGIDSSASPLCPFDPSIACSLVPVPMAGLTSGVTAVSAGAAYACALMESGAVQCWGYNGRGELGDGSQASSLVPVQVTGLTSGVTDLANGAGFNCAVIDGGVQCWGTGPLGNAPVTLCSGEDCSLVPVPIVGF
jgi:alpha-tubulin suppressor-like RCC1 family protein